MEEHQGVWISASTAPIQKDQLGNLDEQLGDLGLTDDDCQQIASFVESFTAEWQTERHEDAFNQTSLIIACSTVSRLEQAIIASRIESRYFLDEIRNAAFHQLGEFQTLAGLLERLRKRLVRLSTPQTISRIKKVSKDVHRPTRQQVESSGSIDDGRIGINGLARHAVPLAPLG